MISGLAGPSPTGIDRAMRGSRTIRRLVTGRTTSGPAAPTIQPPTRRATDRRRGGAHRASKGTLPTHTSTDPPRATTDPPRTTTDRGSATLWAAGGIAALFIVVVIVVWAAVATTTRHRAAAAADLAALAAATYATSGERPACDKARWVATHMHATVKSCRLAGWDALVVVAAAPSGVLAGFGPAEARARAGPVD